MGQYVEYHVQHKKSLEMLKVLAGNKGDCTGYQLTDCRICPVSVICEPGLDKQKTYEAALALYKIKYGEDALFEILL